MCGFIGTVIYAAVMDSQLKSDAMSDTGPHHRKWGGSFAAFILSWLWLLVLSVSYALVWKYTAMGFVESTPPASQRQSSAAAASTTPPVSTGGGGAIELLPPATTAASDSSDGARRVVIHLPPSTTDAAIR